VNVNDKLIKLSIISFFRGFSTVDLVSEAGTDRLYALKKIRCHSSDDEQTAMNEVNYHKQIHHPAVIECIGSLAIGSADISSNKTSMVLLLLPFYKVIINAEDPFIYFH
jgi:serine/threonine kinase 16